MKKIVLALAASLTFTSTSPVFASSSSKAIELIDSLLRDLGEPARQIVSYQEYDERMITSELDFSHCEGLEDTKFSYKGICVGLTAGFRGNLSECLLLDGNARSACMGMLLSQDPLSQRNASKIFGHDMYAQLIFRGATQDGKEFGMAHLINDAMGAGEYILHELEFASSMNQINFSNLLDDVKTQAKEFISRCRVHNHFTGIDKTKLWTAVTIGIGGSLPSQKKSNLQKEKDIYALQDYVESKLFADQKKKQRQLISQVAKEMGMPYLVHFTSKANLVKILQNGAMSSASISGVETFSCSNKDLVYLALSKTLPAYQNNSSTFLVFKSEVMDSPNECIITPSWSCGKYTIDSAHSGGHIRRIQNTLAAISYRIDEVDHMHLKDNECTEEAKNEVTFRNHLDLSNLIAVYVEPGKKIELIKELGIEFDHLIHEFSE